MEGASKLWQWWGKIGNEALRLEEEEGGLIYLLTKTARYVLQAAPDIRTFSPGCPGPRTSGALSGPCPGCQWRRPPRSNPRQGRMSGTPDVRALVRGPVRGGQKVQRTLLSILGQNPGQGPDVRTPDVRGLSGVHRRLSTPSVYLGQGLRTSPDVRDPGCPGSIRGPFRGVQNT